MKLLFVFVICVAANNVFATTSEEDFGTTETCCSHAESSVAALTSESECGALAPPEDIEPEQLDVCLFAMQGCCEKHFESKDDCAAGIKFATSKGCSVSNTEIGKICCEDCLFGKWTGESGGKAACGSPAEDFGNPTSTLRKNAAYQCCLEAAEVAEQPESTTKTTTTLQTEATTQKKQRCRPGLCDQVCDDDGGVIKCSCRSGYRLQADKKTCKDINECAEATDDLCTAADTVCHNTPGAFKCVPMKKREAGLTCPPGFKRNLLNQVCDDINECQLPRPPCPKYLCENTIGAYKCSGKMGKPFTEAVPGAVTEPTVVTSPKNDICPPGFRAGPDEECLDVDECQERLDDCQRLSQHCINTHGSYFCQDHVSKHCAPGFKVNVATGVCEDIDECEDSTEACQRTEICINLPGAYNCKSKISTLPRLATKSCQEGTRIRPGGSICEDIDECREGSHLCDQYQNCINTFGGHECRCKNGFELDSSTGSCIDVNECALKLDNCGVGKYCQNLQGSYTCTRKPAVSSTTTSTVAPPLYEYEYYDSDEENGTGEGLFSETLPTIPTPPRTTTRKPTTSSTTTTTTTTTTPRTRPTSPSTTSTSTTTTTTTPKPPRSDYPYYPRPRTNPPPVRRPDHPRRIDYPPRRDYYPRRPDPTRPEPTQPEPTPGRPESSPAGPEDRRANEIGDDNPDDGFNIDEVHCLDGYIKDAEGNCVDEDECASGQHACRNLEICVNEPGGYICECFAGFKKGPSGYCVPLPQSSSSTTTSTTTSTSTTTETAVSPSPSGWRPPYRPPPPRYPGRYSPSAPCGLGYKFDPRRSECVDINECETNTATCSTLEDCVNFDGGFKCECGRRCREGETPTATPAPLTTPKPTRPSSPTDSRNIITVGAQYGQRGPYSPRPIYSRVPDIGAVVASCPWGYKLTPDKRCYDIDECARNITECGSQQRCENFYGGYSCQCPAGHRLVGQNECEDINECMHGNPCGYNADCANTVGSYRCVCREGFRNAPSNDKVCVDMDECSETPGICAQACSNTWGSYRCYCRKGYRLDDDNKTCVDVNECEEYSSVRLRGKLCSGECINELGSYRCGCPAGYRLSDDGRSCIDIDECETGEAHCASGTEAVCQNTRGSYHCHRIDCPPGYQLESKHRCSRVQRSCPVGDWTCLQQPSSYSYNFITFVANIYLPTGSVDLFTMHGPAWRESIVSFEMRMLDVQASTGVKPADFRCFDMRPSGNICVISLLCSLEGPQVVELELTMSLYQRSMFAGSAVARLVVIVSQYDY